MVMKGGLGDLMKQAKKMQEKLQTMQDDMTKVEVCGESGAGLVKVVMTGRHDVRSVEIDASLLKESKEILEDLLAAAVNDAVRSVEQNQKDKNVRVNFWYPIAIWFQIPLSIMSTTRETAIEELTEALRILPGVGPKTAQRMVLHLLEKDRDGAKHLANKMTTVMDKVQHCDQCRNFTESEICGICRAENRDNTIICVVENPRDVIAIEQTGHYRGKYFVLMGTLSPIDGLGPDEIGMADLLTRCCEGVLEVVLAVGSSVTGEATAHYISEMLKMSEVLQLKSIKVSRLAQGIPVGGDLEYIDGGTLSRALAGRTTI